MTYEESWPDRVTRHEVARELKAHSCSLLDFVNEFGNEESYDSKVVLGWLGY